MWKPTQLHRSLEHRVVSKREILNNAIIKVLDNFPNLWTQIVIFGENGFTIKVNNGHAVQGLAKPSNRTTRQPRLYG